MLPSSDATTSRHDSTVRKTIQLQLPEPKNTQSETIITRPEDTLSWRKFKIKSGDNMALIFHRAGEQAKTLHDIISSGKEAEQLKHLLAGQTVKLGYSGDNQLQELRLNFNKRQQLVISRKNEQWQPNLYNEEVETHIEHVAATIKDFVVSKRQPRRVKRQNHHGTGRGLRLGH